MKKVVVLLAALGAFCGLAQAQEKVQVLSTQELVNVCKLPASPESRSFCVGYITAIYDTYLATRHPQRAKPYICVKQPAEVQLFSWIFPLLNVNLIINLFIVRNCTK